MNMRGFSTRRLLTVVCAGALLTAAALLLAGYLWTGERGVMLSGLLLTIAFFVWGVIFMVCLQKKLSQFTDSLCRTLDGMMDGNERPKVDYEAETLLARISHRLERLYQVMQSGTRKVEKEKMELQSLVSDISHQIKTPIANLKMLNDTLLTRPMSEEKRREFLQATVGQLDKLEFLIQAMVKTSRLETGVIALQKRDAPISDTLAEAINGVLTSMEQNQIILSVECPSDLCIPHDKRWTSEAIFNLLDNAVKYTPSGGRVRVSVGEWELYVKIDITDTGRGIPECEHAAIFKRFYREEAVYGVDGIGIGLYLAREIVTMQGGYIKVVSEAGKGASFSVFLPKEGTGRLSAQSIDHIELS